MTGHLSAHDRAQTRTARRAAVRAAWLQARTHGDTWTGTELAGRLGVSPSQGRRILQQWEADLSMNPPHDSPSERHPVSIKLNPIMLVLGTLAAVVGGWGLFVMMTRIGGAPPFIGVITIAILELFAVGLGIHAVKVARDGDSPFPFNLGITLVAVLAAAVQFSAAVQEGKGILFGTVMAMAPIAAITLWVVEVRRVFRLQGRAAGTVAQPAATIEPALWLRFFKQAWTAKKFALIDRSLGADDAMKLGILHGQPKPKAVTAPVRRDRGIAVEDVLPELRSLTAGIPATNGATSTPPATNGHRGYAPPL